jgi:hypothetical protein
MQLLFYLIRCKIIIIIIIYNGNSCIVILIAFLGLTLAELGLLNPMIDTSVNDSI